MTLRLPPVEREVLPGGATALVARKPGVPLVTVRLMVRAGAALDPPGRLGLASLAAAVARRGTRRRSGRRIDELVESLGADLGTGCDDDATYVALSAQVEDLPRLVDLVVDVASAPAFPKDEFERVRRRELAGLEHDLDDPTTVADRAMIGAAYRHHPYGHPVEGKARDLSAARRRDAVAFHEAWFGPVSTILSVVGAVDPGKALRLSRRALAGWRAAAKPAAEIPAAPAAPRSVLLVDKPDATQTQVRLATPVFGRSSPDYFPAVVANAALGGGFTSRLVETIRVNRGLSYGVRSRFGLGRAAGLWVFSSFTKAETTGELLRVALEEIGRFCDEGPSAEELARAQGYLAGLFPLSLETHDQLAAKLCDVELYGYPMDQVTGYAEQVRAVTAEACREVSRRWLPHAGGAIVAVGPAASIRRQLEPFGQVEVVSPRRVI
ncbi:MAG TPA: pitrilysin family protein [Anaeromyxobacteraceae bacterium]|nr:pitrilysin family protein [Anaeromyxobacteraceae bacterium]